MKVNMTGLPDGQWLDLNTVSVGHKTIFWNGYCSQLDNREVEIIEMRPCKTMCIVRFNCGQTSLAYNTELMGAK